MMKKPQSYYSSSIPNKANARNQLHKLLLQHKSEERILKEITDGACIYQQTKANQSALFLAICHRYENVTSKLLKIYEEDYKILLENGYTQDSTVLFAFGKEDFYFVESEISKFSEKSSELGCKIIILCKEKNELKSCVKLLNPKTEEDHLVVLRIIEKIYNNGSFDVNMKSFFGDTLFHVAAHQGYINVLEKLMALGAVFDQQNDNKFTPFYYACTNNNLEVVKYIHKTYKVDLLKSLMETDLVFSIAGAGNIEIFEYFLKQIKQYEGEEQLKDIFQLKTDYHEYNVLQKAVVNEKQEFVIRCLEYNPDLIVKNNCGDNILHLAFKSQNGKELSHLLVKKRPELLLKVNMNEWTPLHILATRGWTKEFIRIYQKYPNFKNSFFCVAEDEKLSDHSVKFKLTPAHIVMVDVVGNSHFELAAFIIENHPEQFESSKYISELLNQAVGLKNSIEFIKQLQKLKNFNVNIPDRNKNYALILALKARQLENYNYLVSTCTFENFNAIIDVKEQTNLLFYAIWEPIEIDLKIESQKTLSLDLDSDSDEEKIVVEKKAPLATFEIEDTYRDDFKEQKLSYYKIFEKLLSEKVNVQLKDSFQETLLHVAVRKNNSEVLKRVLECGLNLEDVDKNGNTLLHLVNSVNIFRYLMTKVKPEMLNQKNNLGQTPLVSFLKRFEFETKESTELLKEILSYNPDINVSDKNKNTPLHVVSVESWANALIEQGADINATNFIGENVVHLALKMQRWTLAKLFLTTTSIDRFAVNNDNVSYLGYIALSNVDYREIFDGGLENMFELLIQKFTNGKAMNGGSLPISALFYDSDLPLRLIKCHDADVHSKSPENLTCLHCAIILNSKLSFDIVKELVSKGVAINEPNEQGKTPLMLSIEYKKSDISNYLLSQESIELDLQDLIGYTALHYAAHHRNVEVICKLLQSHANYHLLNNENKSFHDKLNQFNKQLFCFYSNKIQQK